MFSVLPSFRSTPPAPEDFFHIIKSDKGSHLLPLFSNSASHALSFCLFVFIHRATAVQSPPSSYSFRALVEEEEERCLVRAGQTGTQRSQGVQGLPVTPTAAARRVTFKSAENSEPEKSTGLVCILYTHTYIHT